MKNVFKRFVDISLIVILFVFCFIGIENKIDANVLTPVEKHGNLSVNGTSIVDKNGEKFSLRGVSTHGIAWFPQYVNYETFKFMRDEWKINVIRLAMYSDPNAGYNKGMHEKVKEGIEYAKSLGLYVIVDWHILNDNNPNMYKAEAIEFFKEIATKYKDDANIIYEICNEPNGNTEWEKDVKPYAKEVISEIRKIDTDAIIIVGTPQWCQNVDIVSQSPLGSEYTNVMYALHFYAATHRDDIRNKLNTALSNNLPVIVSEFGICDASGNGGIDENEANKWIELLESKGISYIIWNLSNKNESSALIRSDVGKTSGWSFDELSQEGRWFYNILQKYQKDDLTANTIKKEEKNEVNENTNNKNDEVLKENNKQNNEVVVEKVNKDNDFSIINIYTVIIVLCGIIIVFLLIKVIIYKAEIRKLKI